MMKPILVLVAAVLIAVDVIEPPSAMASTRDDSMRAPMIARLSTVNRQLGYHLFKRVAVHDQEIDFYVDGSSFDNLSGSDQKLALEVAETVAAGEWHKRSAIPRSGLTVVLKDEFGKRLAVASGVTFEPKTRDGAEIP